MIQRPDTDAGPSGYGCHRLKTFDEAEQICNRKGYRMCSLQEVKEGRVKGTVAAWIPKDLDRHRSSQGN